MAIARRLELHLVDKLATAVPGHTFVPFTGGSESFGAVEMEPPFTVVYVVEVIKSMAQNGTWECAGTVQVVTNKDEATSQAHSELAQSIYIALGAVGSFQGAGFILHGLDIHNMNSATDDELSAHADIIGFTAGVDG